MKVNIIKVPNTDKVIQDCYHYIVKKYREEQNKLDSDLRKSVDKGTIKAIQHRRSN
ncbi:hypothetical protein AB3U99_15175 [Niallia sp. JL1B1071]|uniref:hypothetical protein n=1 Tax=Niallia TaxID=2837506 RepID=UPI002E1D2BD1|nr:hypothetical protein [Niallia alba]